ncbi:MAG: YncE family protein [Chloroflexi bacterium]|nr:YncE family protein [Chloroflexota bacterium]
MKNRLNPLFLVPVVAGVLLVALLLVTVAGAQGPVRSNLSAAQVNYPITYQGRLNDNAGNPIASRTVNLTFRLYEQPTGGVPVWTQTRPVTTDAGGLFTTILEINPPLGIADLSRMWLGIEVATDGEMAPRQRVGGAPFALTLVPGNGITGTINLSDGPGAIIGVVNSGTGHGLLARTEGQGVGVFGSSQLGFGGYFTSQDSHALVVDGPVLLETNLRRVALHRWYEVNEAGITFGVGGQPKGILFDGASLWVTNSMSDTITRRRASDGDLMGTYRVGTYPIGMVYDGARLWVANRGDNTITRIAAANPAISHTIATGLQPNGLCFDGRYVWVVNEGSNNVTRIRASTGVAEGSFAVGQSPRLCAFDGANIWVSNNDSNTVTVLRHNDGSLVRTVSVGTNPVAVLFDGANIWTANAGSNNVTKIRAGDGQVLGTFAVGKEPRGITFDGFHVWVTNYADNTVTKLRTSNGLLAGTYNVGNGPRGITFDGADIWVVNGDADTIIKL